MVLHTVGSRAPEDDHAVFAAGLARTLSMLQSQGRQVYVVLPVPEVDRDVSGTLAREALLGRRIDFAPTRAAYDRRQGFTRTTIQTLAARYGVVEIDPARRLCPVGRCRLTLAGHPLYYDADHLSQHGAAYLAPLMAPVFEGTPRPAAMMTAAAPQIMTGAVAARRGGA